MAQHPTKYPTVRYVFDRRKKCDKDKSATGTIEVEISYRGKRKWISTGVSVAPRQWSPEKLVVNHPSCAELNNRIKAVKDPIDSYINGLMLTKVEFSFEAYEAYRLNASVGSDSFLTFLSSEIDNRKDIRESSRKQHRKLEHRLADSKKITTFNSLTRATIKDFDDWLHQRDYVQSTVHFYHKVMKTYITRAVTAGLMEASPYDGFKVDCGKPTARRYLTEEQIMQIKNCADLPASIARVRDLFIFQCYTGLAYADLEKFDFNKVVIRSGQYVLIDRRKKTDEDFYAVLLPPAVEILKKYDNKLPIISNQQYNLRLKVLAHFAKLDTCLTSHMGRHTFACLALNHGMPIEVLAKAMGHSRISTTQIYAKLVNKTVEEAFLSLSKELS